MAVTDSSAGDGHGPGQNLFTLLTAQYTDGGATGGVPALVGSTLVELQVKPKEAEHFDGSHAGIQVLDRATARAGKRLGDIDHNEWVSYDPVNLQGISSVTVGASSGSTGGNIEFRSGSPTGQLLGTATIPSTGGWDNVISPTVNLTNPGGTINLYAVFVNPAQVGGTPDLMSVDWLRFNGAGVKQESGTTVSVAATPTSGTAPRTVAFTGNAVVAPGRTITDYAWDFGNNAAVVHTANASHTFTRKGSYTARFTVTDSSGATTSAQVVITVT